MTYRVQDIVTIMEPWKTFSGRAMRQPNVRTKILMREKPPKVESKRWGDNVIMVTLVDLQHKEQGRT